MKTRIVILWVLAMALSTMVSAKPRSLEQMKDAARRVLVSKTLTKRAPSSAAELKVLRQGKAYSVIGRNEGGFAIIAADDRMPEVIGYSQSSMTSSLDNAGLNWWLAEVDRALATGYEGEQVVPDPEKYPDHVDPMVKAQWGQGSPYNLFTPVDAEAGKRTQTGCVAVAMSQVMHHWRYPTRGQGKNTVYYPYYDIENADAYTVYFSAAHYEWDKMRDVYMGVDYTREEAEAMATLMYHCGVACYMMYGTEVSGAYMQKAADGLRKYFGYPQTVKDLFRNNYTDQATWMDILYNELASGRPVLYGGDDSRSGGHAFVIDGYDADGLVHVNWGWQGDSDGFYNINVLNPQNYEFKENHEMVIGIAPDDYLEPKTMDVALTAAGQLAQRVGDDKYAITELKISGPLNSDDVRTLREMTGRTSTNTGTSGLLYKLDLSDAHFVSGGEPYLVDGDKAYTTSDDALPERMFTNCEGIASLVLPKSVKEFGSGAFAYCFGLDAVTLPEAPKGIERNFKVDAQGLVTSLDGKELLGVMAAESDTLKVPEGIERLHEFALAGDLRHPAVILPSTLTRMGERSMDNKDLTYIKTNAKTPPRMDAHVFGDLIFYYCMLYVPAGQKTTYTRAEQWKDFKGTYYNNYWRYPFDNIHEFGSIVKAHNTSRLYGEDNPELGYSIQGVRIHGVPILTCEASVTSPVGKYSIVITRGSITEDNVVLENGYLNVLPASLTAKAVDCQRAVGQDNPDFIIEYDGFKNGDTEADLLQRPVVTTTATKDSPAGKYPLVVSGGKAKNYNFEYVDGFLTIVVADAISNVSVPTSVSTTVYDLQGRRLVSPSSHHGIVILRTADGKVKKVKK